MTDRESFIRAICDQPDDDAPRLVLADWLDEHGESERAEFIRVQCELARMDRETTHSQIDLWAAQNKLHDRERELLAGHNVEWSRPLPGPFELSGNVLKWDFIRGFVGSIECSAADWLTHADTILREHPVQSVRLTTLPKMRVARHGSTIGAMKYRGRLLSRRWRDLRDLPCGEGADDEATARSLLAAEWPAIKTWDLPPRLQTISDAGGLLVGFPTLGELIDRSR